MFQEQTPETETMNVNDCPPMGTGNWNTNSRPSLLEALSSKTGAMLKQNFHSLFIQALFGCGMIAAVVVQQPFNWKWAKNGLLIVIVIGLYPKSIPNLDLRFGMAKFVANQNGLRSLGKKIAISLKKDKLPSWPSLIENCKIINYELFRQILSQYICLAINLPRKLANISSGLAPGKTLKFCHGN